MGDTRKFEQPKETSLSKEDFANARRVGRAVRAALYEVFEQDCVEVSDDRLDFFAEFDGEDGEELFLSCFCSPNLVYLTLMVDSDALVRVCEREDMRLQVLEILNEANKHSVTPLSIFFDENVEYEPDEDEDEDDAPCFVLTSYIPVILGKDADEEDIQVLAMELERFLVNAELFGMSMIESVEQDFEALLRDAQEDA